MKIGFYLVVNSRGSVRTNRKRPSLAMDEISIYQTMDLPDALFEKPQIIASVVIPSDAAMPQEITSEVSMNVKEAIEQATGLEVRLMIEEPTE